MPTIGEANSISRLIDWIIGGRGPSGDPVTSSMARDHAAWLAERAYSTLSAGKRAEQVKERWPAEHPLTDDEITPEMANHVLAHFNEGGYRAGSFTMLLIELISRADPWNRSRMALGFPAYVRAVHLAQDTREGIAKLTTIAGGPS